MIDCFASAVLLAYVICSIAFLLNHSTYLSVSVAFSTSTFVVNKRIIIIIIIMNVLYSEQRNPGTLSDRREWAILTRCYLNRINS